MSYQQPPNFRPLMRDPSLPHQIVLSMSGNETVVSCNCLRTATKRGGVESRTLWQPGEAIAAYRAWHSRGGGGQPHDRAPHVPA